MQLNNKRKKFDTSHPAHDLFDNDFSSILYESKFEKIKPALKALIVISILTGVVWGVSAYFAGANKRTVDKTHSVESSQSNDDSNAAFLLCTTDMNTKNPIPEAGDANFYPKLVAYYDAQIDCYDQYPDASSVVSRSSLEHQRDNTLNSSGAYKDSYTPSIGSGSSTSSRNTVTGCDYSLSESDYLSCTDRYYATRNSPGSAPSGSAIPPSYTPPSSTLSTPEIPPDPSNGAGGSSADAGQNDPYAALNTCLAEARSLSTEASRARAIQGCHQNHTP